MIHLQHVDLIYSSTDGTDVHALEGIDLQVAENEFLVIVGPSGCGKSTLLKLIVGLLRPTRGAVMYRGRFVELADRDSLYGDPLHPYTRALLEAVPIPDPAIERARARPRLPGEAPSPHHPPQGCLFQPRCSFASDECRRKAPELREVKPGHFVACINV